MLGLCGKRRRTLAVFAIAEAVLATAVVVVMMMPVSVIQPSAWPSSAGRELVFLPEGCVPSAHRPYPADPGAGHPPKNFYTPGDVVPLEQFGHIIGDGMAVLRYHPSLGAQGVAAVREYIASAPGQGVFAAADADLAGAFAVDTRLNTVVCKPSSVEAAGIVVRQWYARETGHH